MILSGKVESTSPLLVLPRGAASGQPVQRIADTVSTVGWQVGDEVLCALVDGQLWVFDRMVSP